ncbi:crAss001_48 related protein [Pseudoalteromonas rubra]|uniref:crAss001_48 related protein n=1 Tax=Pseudoalteromonas rubra TaxID=43658 RepID=UPI002DBDF3FC|nr:hypothetical protein [Pseudoalteromonas rubra]MEC4091602.1 hypothetical protein [Pseudoalteromonas rubra]
MSYLERLKKEFEELTERLKKLGAFLNSDNVSAVNEVELYLLNLQFYHMQRYQEILNQRLNGSYGQVLIEGIDLIAMERWDQIHAKGYDTVHDQQYKTSALGNAAICYAIMAGCTPRMRKRFRHFNKQGRPPNGWPWSSAHFKPGEGDSDQERVRELTKAAALIAAEIDRIERKKQSPEAEA